MHFANSGKHTSTSITTLRRQQEWDNFEEYAVKKELADMKREIADMESRPPLEEGELLGEPTSPSTTYSTYVGVENETRGKTGGGSDHRGN